MKTLLTEITVPGKIMLKSWVKGAISLNTLTLP